MTVVRSASLRGFADLVESLGGNPQNIARRVGLPPAALHDEGLLISAVAEAEVMEAAAESLNCADFGLRLSEYQDISGLGPLALALRHSPTLGEALACANRFLHVHSRGSRLVTASDDPDGVFVTLRYARPMDEVRFKQSHENALLNLHRVIELLAGGSYGLQSVDLGHGPLSALERYEELFGGARIRASRKVTQLRASREALNLPVIDADESLRQIATFYLSQQTAPRGLETTVQVQVIIEAILGTGRVGMNSVAQRLELSPRTLQRRLAGEGTSLSEVLDGVRRQRVDQLLTTDMPIVDVASSVDLDQATLSRYARRWWDATPSQRRAVVSTN